MSSALLLAFLWGRPSDMAMGGSDRVSRTSSRKRSRSGCVMARQRSSVGAMGTGRRGAWLGFGTMAATVPHPQDGASGRLPHAAHAAPTGAADVGGS